MPLSNLFTAQISAAGEYADAQHWLSAVQASYSRLHCPPSGPEPFFFFFFFFASLVAVPAATAPSTRPSVLRREREVVRRSLICRQVN